MGDPPAHTKIAVHHRRSLWNTSTITYSSALTSKPNPPITPRAKRLASVFDKQGIRGENQKNGEDGYGYGYERQDLLRRNSCVHVASDVQQRCDPKEAQREDHDALQQVRESGPDNYHGCHSLSPAPFSCLYSPKCVEKEFSEVPHRPGSATLNRGQAACSTSSSHFGFLPRHLDSSAGGTGYVNNSSIDQR